MEGSPSKHRVSQEVISFWEHRHVKTIQEGLLMKESKKNNSWKFKERCPSKDRWRSSSNYKMPSYVKTICLVAWTSCTYGSRRKNCIDCIKNQPDRTETLILMSLPKPLWQIVATDLLKLGNDWYIILADCFFRYR